MTILLHALAGLIGGYAAISLLEWAVHRHHMHRRGWLDRVSPWLFANHQRIHHPAYRRDFEAADPEEHAETGLYFDVIGSLAMLAIPMLVLGYFLPVESATFVLMALAHHLAWNAAHREMHRPCGRWFARTRAYRFLREYHRDHHRYPNANFNAVAPGADWLLGTLHRRDGTPRRPETAASASTISDFY